MHFIFDEGILEIVNADYFIQLDVFHSKYHEKLNNCCCLLSNAI